MALSRIFRCLAPCGRGDSGAGTVEYALGAALLLVAVVMGLQWVQSAGETALDRQADNIDYFSEGGGAPATTSSSSTSTTTTTSSTPAPPSTPPSTAAPPPTTSPTTTVAPTTTTTPSTPEWSKVSITSSANWTQQGTWWSSWDAVFRFSYTWVHPADLTLQVRKVAADGTSTVTEQGFYTGNGTLTIGSGFGPSTAAKDKVAAVEVTVIRVSTGDSGWQPLVWEGRGVSAISAPPGGVGP